MRPMTAPALLTLLAALSGAASTSPSLAVVVVRRAALAKGAAADIATEVTAALQAAGVVVDTPPAAVAQKLKAAGLPESESCDGAKMCVMGMGGKLGVQVLVAIEVGALGKSVAIHLEALTIPDGKRLAQHDVLAQQDNLKKLAGVDGFAGRLQAALSSSTSASAEPKPKPKPKDAASDKPKLVDPPPPLLTVRDATAHPTDAHSAPAAAVAKPVATEKGHTASFVLGGTAVAAGIAAAILGGFAYDQNDKLAIALKNNKDPTIPNLYHMDGKTAYAMQNDRNLKFGASMGCLVALAGFGVVAVVVW